MIGLMLWATSRKETDVKAPSKHAARTRALLAGTGCEGSSSLYKAASLTQRGLCSKCQKALYVETSVPALRGRVCVCIQEPGLGMENAGLTCDGEVRCVVTQGPESLKSACQETVCVSITEPRGLTYFTAHRGFPWDDM